MDLTPVPSELLHRQSFAPSEPFSYTLIPYICAPDRVA